MNRDSARKTVTRCLDRLGRGERSGADELLPLVYEELRALAAVHLKRERPDHTLQPTALVHEAYLKLVDQTRAEWRGRSHFFAVAAEAIRRILVDHARVKRAVKRRAPGRRVTIHAELDAEASGDFDLTELDDALNRLAELNQRQSKVVSLRFFGGLSVEETAQVLGVSEGTVKGDWRVARAWLERELSAGTAE
jgi:RNA polymerase sigma factor (TIGR02999 family)